MNTMLVVLFGSIAIGLFGHKIVHHEMKLLAIMATVFVAIYFLHPAWMT